VESARAKATASARTLSKKRATVAKRLAKDVVLELAKLGMKNCAFDTRIEHAPAADSARYWLSEGGKQHTSP
jgi:DNA repair ATPase RecN